MSLAFSAVVLFLIFAPGIILRRSYLSYPFSKRFSASSPTDEVVGAIIPAVVLHLLGIGVVGCLPPRYGINFPALGDLLVGVNNAKVVESVFRNVDTNLGKIAVYNLTLWVLAAVIGIGARGLVLWRGLDLRFRVLRFSNEWYYLLTGRRWGYESPGDFDIVWIDALMGTGDDSVLYSGVLFEYYLSRDGGLESICLSHATKWIAPHSFTEPGPTPTSRSRNVAVDIPGEVLVLKYSEIANLNISFYSTAVTPKPAASHATP